MAGCLHIRCDPYPDCAIDPPAMTPASDTPVDLATGTWADEYVIAAGDRVVEVLALAAGETVTDLLAMALAAGERIARRDVWRGPLQELAHA